MTDYLQLAYLAEFAAAYNLAFGEFKHDKQASDLSRKFKILTQFTSGIFEEEEKNIKYSNYTQTILNKRGENVSRLKNFIQNLTPSASKSKNYDAFQGFKDRVRVFMWVPDYPIDKDGKSKNLVELIFSCFWGAVHYIVAILASWGFSKTALWRYHPCKISCYTWISLVALDSFLIGASGKDFVPSANNIVYAIGGFLLPLFALRPICALFTWLFRASSRVRGKDYPKALFVLVTSVVVFITLKGHTDVAQENLKYWWFLLGFLVFSIFYPLVLSIAYELIDDRVDQILKSESKVGENESNNMISEGHTN